MSDKYYSVPNGKGRTSWTSSTGGFWSVTDLYLAQMTESFTKAFLEEYTPERNAAFREITRLKHEMEVTK